MAVEINIDLDSEKAHGKIEGLRQHLKSLKDEIDIDFNVDEDLKDKIQKITKNLKEINIDVDYSDLKKAAMLKAMLEGDINTKLNVNNDDLFNDINGGLDPPGGSGINHGEQAKKFSDQSGDVGRFNRFMENFKRFGEAPRGPGGMFREKGQRSDFLGQHRTRKIGDPLGLGDYDTDRFSGFKKRLLSGRDSKIGLGRNFQPDLDLGGPDFGKYATSMPDGKALDGFRGKIKKLIPDMHTFYNILAALIPILVVFVTQALGVAAAMGSVAVAGGSILALGLVGHGEDMASSWEKAKEQLGDLKQEMFNTFQPTMQTFAPIQARFFDALPAELDRVASAMEGLTVYSDTLFKAMRGLSKWVANGIRGMADMEEVVSQLALRFGSIIGTNVNDFFRFIVEEASDSQEMLIAVGAAFKEIVVGAYGIFKALVAVLTVFKPLIGVLSVVETLLNNKLAVGIMAFIASAGVAIYSVIALSSAFGTLATIGFAGIIPMFTSIFTALQGYVFNALLATSATYGFAQALATAIAVGTMGLGVIAGLAGAMSAVDSFSAEANMNHNVGSAGFSPGGGAGSSTTQNITNEGDTYNVEVNGQMDNPTEQGLRDIITSEESISMSRSTPSSGGD